MTNPEENPEGIVDEPTEDEPTEEMPEGNTLDTGETDDNVSDG